MLQTKMAPSSAVVRPYVWAYGMTTGRIDSDPLHIPLPARPKQLLTFFFADRYRVRPSGPGQGDASPRATVVVLKRTLGLGCRSLDVSTTSPFISSRLASISCSGSP